MLKRPGLSALLVFVIVLGVGFAVLNSQESYATLSSFKRGEKLGQTFGVAGLFLAIVTYLLLKRRAG